VAGVMTLSSTSGLLNEFTLAGRDWPRSRRLLVRCMIVLAAAIRFPAEDKKHAKLLLR
jgi:hypothetical protein